MFRLLRLLVLVTVTWCIGLQTTARAQEISGAGSTFIFPLLVKWVDSFRTESGISINYQPVGSGAGIRQIKSKTVDFGASDAPLPPEELRGAGLLQFPLVIGGVVPVVHINGVGPGQLRLSGPVLADIYLGKITRWNDKAIADLNAGLTLPDQAIVPTHRSDGSGTTYVFADYLSKVSLEWRAQVGVGTFVEFPGGAGGKGNEGVATFVASNEGTIGYVEYAYAKQRNLASVLVENHDGIYVAPNRRSFESAGANADWTKTPAFYVLPTDEPGKESWPISGATFILVYRQQQNAKVANEMLKFFDWAYRKGTRIAADLDYVEMPRSVVELAENSWTSIKLPGGNSAWTASAVTQH
jgi:phosphate transport system substrate-binding protein